MWLTLAFILCLLITPARSAEPVVEPSLKPAFDLLEHTKLGLSELKRARELNIPIELGQVSKTDIVASRVSNGKDETYKFTSKVIVDQNKEPAFQALDLAHELTHATQSKTNPFDPELTAEAYVEHGIESDGGEAHAIANECAVGQELVKANDASGLKLETVKLIQTRCQYVWATAMNPIEWKHSFYFLGQHYKEFMNRVVALHVSEKAKLNWVQKVETKSPVFASAVAHKPYPLALLEEYVTITHKVCERAQKSAQGRSPASMSLLKERCAAVGTEIAYEKDSSPD